MENRRFYIEGLGEEKTLVIEHLLQGVRLWVITVKEIEITVYKSAENIWWENGVGYTITAAALGRKI